jgi:hypothetical protein
MSADKCRSVHSLFVRAAPHYRGGYGPTGLGNGLPLSSAAVTAIGTEETPKPKYPGSLARRDNHGIRGRSWDAQGRWLTLLFLRVRRPKTWHAGGRRGTHHNENATSIMSNREWLPAASKTRAPFPGLEAVAKWRTRFFLDTNDG